MSRFIGKTQGIMSKATGEATRKGTIESGLKTIAASSQGAVRVLLYEKNGIDFAHVRLVEWEGAGTDKTVYNGPISGKAEQTPPDCIFTGDEDFKLNNSEIEGKRLAENNAKRRIK